MKNSAILAAAVSLLFFLTSCAAVSTSVKNEQAALTTDENVRLAGVYETKGELELALKFYKLAADENKNSADIYFALGNVNLKMKLYKDAENAYKKAIELQPANPAAYNNLSWLYLQTSEFGKAEEAAKKAVKTGPHDIHVYLDTLGVAQTLMGKLTEAEENLREAVALTPPEEKEGLKQIFKHQLELYKKTGDSSKAESVQNRLNQLN